MNGIMAWWRAHTVVQYLFPFSSELSCHTSGGNYVYNATRYWRHLHWLCVYVCRVYAHIHFISSIFNDCCVIVVCALQDPRYGRNNELPGEDPYLTGSYGIEYVKGLQAKDSNGHPRVNAYLKHFDAYVKNATTTVHHESARGHLTMGDSTPHQVYS